MFCQTEALLKKTYAVLLKECLDVFTLCYWRLLSHFRIILYIFFKNVKKEMTEATFQPVSGLDLCLLCCHGNSKKTLYNLLSPCMHSTCSMNQITMTHGLQSFTHAQHGFKKPTFVDVHVTLCSIQYNKVTWHWSLSYNIYYQQAHSEQPTWQHTTYLHRAEGGRKAERQLLNLTV